MKYLLHTTAPIWTSIEADNLRGEPRWERAVLGALIRSGAQVHTTNKIWHSDESIPDNLYDGYNEAWADDSVLITHGIMRNPHITRRAKYYMVQYHEPPDAEHKHLFLNYDKENPGCIVALTSTRNPGIFNKLNQHLGSEKVELVTGPNVSQVYDTNNFKKPYLTWAYRNFMYLALDIPSQLQVLFNRVKRYMQEESELRVALIVGLWDTAYLSIHPTNEQAKEWVFTHSFISCLEEMKDRVDVFINIDHHRMLEIFEQTRFVISPPEPAGLPPFEVGAYGVPVIVGNDRNPFDPIGNLPSFPELLKVKPKSATGPFLDIIERLYRDEAYYRKHGNAYREYIRIYATYNAFMDDIENIIKKRGWG